MLWIKRLYMDGLRSSMAFDVSTVWLLLLLHRGKAEMVKEIVFSYLAGTRPSLCRGTVGRCTKIEMMVGNIAFPHRTTLKCSWRF